MQFWLRLVGAVVLFGLAVIWAMVIWIFTRSVHWVQRTVSGVLAGPICRTLRLRVQLHGVERFEGLGSSVFIANHQSLACHAVLANLYRRIPHCIMVGKLVGKWNIPVFVGLFRRTGNIIVDPSRPVFSGRALQQAVKALRAGTTVGVYPEGTRRKDTRRLGPFHRGAFVMAVDAGRPVVPVVVSRFKPRLDAEARRMLPQTVHVRVLEPILTDGLTREDVPRIRDTAAARMQAVLDADEAARTLTGEDMVQEEKG